MRGLVLDRAAQPLRNICKTTTPANYGVASGSTGAGNTVITLVPAGATGPQGREFRRVTFTGAFTPPVVGSDLVSFNAGTFGVSTIPMTTPIDVGRSYSCAVPVRCSAAQKVKASAQAIGPTAGAAGTKNGPDATLVPGVWTYLLVENYVPTVGTVGLRLDLDGAASGWIDWSAGDTLDIGRPYIFEGKTVPIGLLSDGDTPGWKWLGAVRASDSVGWPYMLESIAGAPQVLVDGMALPSSDTSTLLGTLPATGLQGRTLYYVHDIFDMLGTTTIVRLGGTTAGTTRALINYGLTQFSGSLFNDLDASVVTSSPAWRAVGRHVGVLSVSDGVTRVTAGLDGQFVTSSVHPAPTPFTVGDVRGYRTIANIKTGLIAAYVGEHDAETQKRVTAWLARKYGSPIPAGF